MKEAAGKVPATMTAVIADGSNGLAIVERPVPQPGEGEVLIRVAAAGVNRPDVLQRMGLYPPPPGAPDVLGLEVAGHIFSLGKGVPADLLETPVCCLLAGGGYAEYALAPPASRQQTDVSRKSAGTPLPRLKICPETSRPSTSGAPGGGG